MTARNLRLALPVLLAATSLIPPAGLSAAQIDARIVHLATPPLEQHLMPVSLPQIDADGHVTFALSLSREFRTQAVGGNVIQRVRQEDPSPGVPDARFRSLYEEALHVDDAGHMVFFAEADVPGYEGRRRVGFWSSSVPTGPVPVALTGDQAAGTPTGATFTGFDVDGLRVSRTGDMLFSATIGGVGTGLSNDHGLWAYSAGDGLKLVARDGDPAPGFPPSHVFAGQPSFGGTTAYVHSTLNDVGQIAFTSRAIDSATDPAHAPAVTNGVWAGTAQQLTLVARRDDPAPGVAGSPVFSKFRPPKINNAGQVIFAAGLMTQSNGIWTGHIGGGPLSLVAVTGDTIGAPPGTSLFFPYAPVISDNGRIAYTGFLAGEGVSSDNNKAAFAIIGGAAKMLVRSGDAVPGSGGRLHFADRTSADFVVGMNDNGYAVVPVSVLDDADSRIRRALLVFAPDGKLAKSIMTGDTISVAPGDIRTVESVWTSIGDNPTYYDVEGANGRDGYPSGLNDANQLAIMASFTDGSAGVFVIAIPEPSPLGVTTAAIAALLMVRRRRGPVA